MFRKLIKRSIGTVLLVVLCVGIGLAGITGKIKGKVIAQDTREPVVGASIVIVGTAFGAAADVEGEYFIINVPVGRYSVRASAVGHRPTMVTNVTVSADLTTTVDFQLVGEAVQAGEVIVTAERPLVEKSATATLRATTARDVELLPRESIQGIIGLTAGVVNGVNIRGGRGSENVIEVDGISVNDPQSGGYGPSAGFASAVSELSSGQETYYPTVSNLAVSEVQVITGGFNAEYGNALSGVVNTVTKEGSSTAYEGVLRYKRDFQGGTGFADNGIRLAALNESIGEFGFGGPLPGGIRFYAAGKSQYQQYRNAGIMVIDPVGNNEGRLQHSNFIQNSLNLKINYSLLENIKLTVSGFRGTSSWEYNDFAHMYHQAYLQQPSYNQINTQLFARITHTLSASTFWEGTVSYYDQEFQAGKKSEKSYNFWETYNVYGLDDNLTYDDNLHRFVPGKDGIIDRYTEIDGEVRFPDGVTRKVRIKNPLTGLIEGSEFYTATDNPYGVTAFRGFESGFTKYGNSRTLEQRSTKTLGIDGDFNSQLDKYNYIKAGAEVKINTVYRDQNSLAWDPNPFKDEYTFYPLQGAVYVQDKVEIKGLVLNPGIRLDVFNPKASVHTDPTDLTSPLADAKLKTQVSPRFGIAYPVTDRTVFHLNYGWFFQEPPYIRLYTSIVNPDLSRANQQLGNPNLGVQKTKSFEIGLANQLSEDFALDITGYYKDLYNIEGISFQPAIPTPYFLYTTGEYGNVRGVEFTLTKRMRNYFSARASYALSVAMGSASSVTQNYNLTNAFQDTDPFTTSGKRVFPLTDYYLDFDRRHVINLILDFACQKDEGPSIGGVHFLEHFNANFTTVLMSGLPYTRLDLQGRQLGEYNGARQPWFTETDLRVSREIPLSGLSRSFSRLSLELFVDVTNVFNRVAPVTVYARTGAPDDDGIALTHGDFTETYTKGQYASTGEQLYNARYDTNQDGYYDPLEQYNAAINLKNAVYAQRQNYQVPRRIWFGAMLRF